MDFPFLFFFLCCTLTYSLNDFNREFWKESQIPAYHNVGITGKNKTICIMDSGVNHNFANQLKRPVVSYDFTSDHSTDDYLNHGTASLSILGSTNPLCLGITPDANFVMFKVVDKKERIKTESILQALSKSIEKQCTIVVMSFGGRDLNEPVLQKKMDEVLEHGILLVASAGNEGPSFGSVLSPADYPGVISVGALRNKDTLLVSSSRGYRSHSIQRPLPEFSMHGYKIPCVTNHLQCVGVSGTSIAAPMFAGVAALKYQQFGSSLSPGAFRCLLHGQSSSLFCLYPSSLTLPSEDYPYLFQPLYTQDQPKEVRISLYSHQPFTSFEAKPTCSWVHVDSINSLAPYTSEMVLLISPLSKKGNFSCSILVNSTITLPIAVTMGGVSSQPIIHWIEGEQGNIYTSNGDSAYTNYRTFYRLLQTQYRVHIHQRSTDTFDVCICFDECKMGCRYPFYIVGIEKTRSVMMQQWMRERYQFITLRHGKACSAKIQGKSFRNIHDYVEVVKVPEYYTIMEKIENNYQQIVGFVAQNSSACFGFLGIGSIINDMSTLSELPGKQMLSMIKSMYSIINSFENYEELLIVCFST